MRDGVTGFKGLPLSKQLSIATASYDLLGVGNGEQFKTVEALVTEIARERKERNDKRKAEKSTPAKPAKASKGDANPLAEMLAYLVALDFAKLGQADQALITEIESTISIKMATAE